ncbi:hypothetical protein P153DRAFT_369165 [Dothidotthia symphoricarpi CBS 119687]|uniref:RING-type E3 ubiquitin transferase n=1 Tax=Dothidotthia symphoricarpi CBS 119687 TaxID=1392245 RepID=A0A6A6A3R5_9PLEO|nr:uncharacterized protein P153DRAFT_369165 [Dothidotthia symphoricarpi CBS 119687]KAF2126450.1 hypothetical protein P153DRAFT_369165 [Dothidotthia symphoricarpi CBS 119687]
MFTAPAPGPPTVSATATATANPPPQRPHGRRGFSFLRGLHLHSGPADDQPPREDVRVPKTRARALTHTPPASPAHAPVPSDVPVPQSPVTRPAPLSRRQTAPTSPAPNPPPPTHDDDNDDDNSSSSSPPATPTAAMTRNRAETTTPQLLVRNNTGPTPASAPGLSAGDPAEGSAEGPVSARHLPSIRFIPHTDPRAGRPSLQFPTITRTLPDESAIIRVGRYSERDNAPEISSNVPSAAAVGFKSKVVSRKHCELWCMDGSWYVKDVKSSSGTFLNHIRLSQPNVESKPFKIKDGDIIQLGIDFRGGEEMIFRCVKIRVECNRGWQQGLNKFNKQTHQRLRNLSKKKDSDSASTHTSECAICLMSIAPCQSLFVAPCSHVWHYKCIRPILNGPTWPNFLCPNCRAVADLEEDVDDPDDLEEWEADMAEESGGDADADAAHTDQQLTPRPSAALLNGSTTTNETSTTDPTTLAHLQQAISNISLSDSHGIPAPQTPHPRISSPSDNLTSSQPVSINVNGANDFSGLTPMFANTMDGLTPGGVHDGPMTPRNDAGPFVLDGSAGRAAGARLRDAALAGGDGDAEGEGGDEPPSLPPIRFN